METKMEMTSSLAAGKSAHQSTTLARRRTMMTTRRRYKRFVKEPIQLPYPGEAPTDASIQIAGPGRVH